MNEYYVHPYLAVLLMLIGWAAGMIMGAVMLVPC